MRERLIEADIDVLFCEMLDLTDDERTIELDRVAEQNMELASNVRALFAMGTKAEAILDAPATDARDSLYEKIAEGWAERKKDEDVRIGEQVGPYTLAAVIGRGARSTVYKGTREGEEWHQQVAIKILRRGIDTDDVIARFHLERQILARLVHPGIAAILDVGVTGDGLPYFAMEQIEGNPVSDYCTKNDLTIRARLTLFLQIAGIVSFAHRHLVIHRDIKPSNILVDADGKATLLDFGISKVLNPDEADTPSVYTRTDVRPLTPDYAAPEQVAGEAITTATDIYQLGVLLGKMLTGDIPQGKNGEANEDLNKLPADLQIIISKAMRIEPEHRYIAVHDLMEDIKRYLDDLPILARAPTLMYRTQKFIQRRRWALPVGVLSTIGVIAYMVMMTIYADRLQVQRDLKATEAARADEIKLFLVDFMRAPDPYEGEGFDVTMQQALANAAANAEAELSDRPELQAEIFATLAEVYGNLDLYSDAAKNWEKNTKIMLAIKPDSLDWFKGRREYAYAMFRTEQKDIAIAELDNTILALEAHQPVPLVDLAITLIYRAEIESEIGNMDQAVAMLKSAVERSRQAGSVGEHQLATALGTLGLVYSNKGEREAALEALNEAITINTKLHGQNSLPVTQTRMSYGDTLIQLGRFEEAGDIYEQAGTIFSELLGPAHKETLTAESNVGYVFNRLKKHAEAEVIYRDILQRRREKYGDKPNMSVAISLINLATSLSYLDRNQDAADALIEGRAIMVDNVAPGHFRLAFPDMTLAHIYEVLGDFDAMEMVARRALSILEPSMKRGTPVREVAQCRLGGALIQQGKKTEGHAEVQDAFDALKAANGPPHLLEECQGYLDM